MQEQRRARLQSVLKDELSVLVRAIKDPRVSDLPGLTITQVEVTPDGSQATVLVTPLGSLLQDGDPAHAARVVSHALAGLASASGFLRRELASRLTVKHIPTLIFKEDRGFANTVRVHELLQKIAATDAAAGPKSEE